MNKEQATYLLQRLMDGEASSSERASLSQMLQQNYPQDQWIDLLEELFHAQTEEVSYNEQEWKPVLEELLQQTKTKQRKVIPMWRKIAVAVSVIGIIFLTYFISTRQKVVNGPSSVVASTDVAPPNKNRAQIKLADGRIIYLDSAANGQLVNTNGITVTKTEDGKIIYTPSAVATPTAVQYNTLMNPRGSKVQPLTLSDGTKVWLNSESSIKYPAAFIGNERKVEITGEAYFEVAHNKLKPFYVSKGDMQVQVLGTHFNVNAYDDEAEIKVTLLEGSVRVSNDVDNKTIKPGEQVVAVSHSPLTTHHSPDLDQVMSWKNGRFDFKGTDIETIMRQVGKWYDVDVVYNDKIKYTFVADIKRDVPVSELLRLLELTNLVHFKIEGKKVIVSK